MKPRTIILVKRPPWEGGTIERREMVYSDDEEIAEYIKSNFKEFDKVFAASISEHKIILHKYYFDDLTEPTSFVLEFDELRYLIKEVSGE